MRNKIQFFPYYILLLTFILSTNSCDDTESRASFTIKLKWHKSYPQDSNKKAIIGLKWVMAYLGADLPSGSESDSFHWLGDEVFELDLRYLGFNEEAMEVWKVLLKKYKSQKAYKEKGYMDLGRFVLLSFNSSWHYYAITGVAKTYDDFKARHEIEEKIDWVIQAKESCVSPGYRLINSSGQHDLETITHIAKEGKGISLDDFKSEEFEVFDYMPNGQPRFAIYGLDGKLRAAANPEISGAGKPAKCMWCHESQVSATFMAKTDTDGYLSLLEVNTMVMQQNELLMQFHDQRKSDLNFSKMHEHELAELIYVGFSHPDSTRISSESVKKEGLNLDRLEFHSFEEYKHLEGFEKSWQRSQIDSLYHPDALKTPKMREASDFEPNYLSDF